MDRAVASIMVKKILLIAYHYPPVRVSSGIQRTLKFSQYLRDFGWQPSVLTVHPRAYEAISDDQIGEIPSDIIVKRAFALDAARHLSIRGIYPGPLALPDRWVSWWLGGVSTGLRMIRRERPAVLWSTYPIATAHLIGFTLHRLTGIPWVADFRDSMTEDGYPPRKRQWQVYRWIERQAVIHCSRAVFTTPSARRMYAERYPTIPAKRWAVIANGYDEENFVHAEQSKPAGRHCKSPLVLVHSGVLYPSERDPRLFFAALADLKQKGAIAASNLQVVLRASGHDAYYRGHIEACGVGDIVVLKPTIPYEAALIEMLNADGLMIFQAANCNHQIPAKVYEYLRARRPIFALTDPSGDTAELLQASGIDAIVPLNDRERIAVGLMQFLDQLRHGKAAIAEPEAVASHSRYARTREFVALLEAVVNGCPN